MVNLTVQYLDISHLKGFLVERLFFFKAFPFLSDYYFFLCVYVISNNKSSLFFMDKENLRFDNFKHFDNLIICMFFGGRLCQIFLTTY